MLTGLPGRASFDTVPASARPADDSVGLPLSTLAAPGALAFGLSESQPTEISNSSVKTAWRMGVLRMAGSVLDPDLGVSLDLGQLRNARLGLDKIRSRRVAAVCGIANPDDLRVFEHR